MWCDSSAHPRGHTVQPSVLIRTAPLVGVYAFWHSQVAEDPLPSVSDIVSADPFDTGTAFLHLVKWSESTSMVMFFLGVGVNGPTRSTDSTCQSRPACSLCRFLFGTGLLCLAAWPALLAFTSHRISAVIPGQNHFLSRLCLCGPAYEPPTPLTPSASSSTPPSIWFQNPLDSLSSALLLSSSCVARGPTAA